jgi:predicted aconitase
MVCQRKPVTVAEGSPHLSQQQVSEILNALETAEGQRRIDLMTELAWRPAWAIRSRCGVFALLRVWLIKMLGKQLR